MSDPLNQHRVFSFISSRLLVGLIFLFLVFISGNKCQAEFNECRTLEAASGCEPWGLILSTTSATSTSTSTSIVGGHLIAATSGARVYSINSSTGALSLVSGSPFGTACYQFGTLLSTDNRWFYAHASSGVIDRISLVDPDNPVLGSTISSTSTTYNLHIPTANANHVVGEAGTTQVQVFDYDSTTGDLTAVSGSPFGSGCYRPGQIVGNMFYGAGDTANLVYHGTYNSTTGAIGTFSTTLVSDTRDPSNYRIEKHPNLDVLYFGKGNGSTAIMTALQVSGSSASVAHVTDSPTTLEASVSGSVQDMAWSIDASRLYIGTDSGRIYVVTIDSATGAMTPQLGMTIVTGLTTVSALAMDPSGNYLYAGADSSGEIQVYSVAADGSLSLQSGSGVSSTGNIIKRLYVIGTTITSTGASAFGD